VKKGGTACRRGRRRRRRGDVEAEEAGALNDGGSGSSPRAAQVFAANGAPPLDGLRFLPPSFFLLPPSPSLTAVWTGKDFPLRRLGLGDPGGLRRRLLIAAGARGHVDGQDAAAVRGARRDGAMAGSPTL
jgi:hypothetical protein